MVDSSIGASSHSSPPLPPTRAFLLRADSSRTGSDGRRYINAGGKPTEAIGFISENYRGYAQMANLVGSWMELVGDAPPPAGGSANGAIGAGGWPYSHHCTASYSPSPCSLPVVSHRLHICGEFACRVPQRPISLPRPPFLRDARVNGRASCGGRLRAPSARWTTATHAGFGFQWEAGGCFTTHCTQCLVHTLHHTAITRRCRSQLWHR